MEHSFDFKMYKVTYFTTKHKFHEINCNYSYLVKPFFNTREHEA